METKSISKSTLKRLPVYLGYLKTIPIEQVKYISATGIASALGMGEVQVRKDLASICDAGKPKVGYEIDNLINVLEDFLGFNQSSDAIIIGAGKLGRALLDYEGFSEYGIKILAAFDNDEALSGQEENGKPIFSMSKLTDLCNRLHIHIAIIAVPSKEAQTVCDLLVENGIKGILNFAPTHLTAPKEILIQNENMATSLALVARHLSGEKEIIQQ